MATAKRLAKRHHADRRQPLAAGRVSDVSPKLLPSQAVWPYLATGLAAMVVVFWAYSPALHGPFLFDDNLLPFALPNFAAPLAAWIHGVRPLLMLTYWCNVQFSGADTYSYHIVNVLLHIVT